jgi:hypothetical protein
LVITLPARTVVRRRAARRRGALGRKGAVPHRRLPYPDERRIWSCVCLIANLAGAQPFRSRAPDGHERGLDALVELDVLRDDGAAVLLHLRAAEERIHQSLVK